MKIIALDVMSDTPKKTENASLSLQFSVLDQLLTFWAPVVAHKVCVKKDTLTLLQANSSPSVLSAMLVKIT